MNSLFTRRILPKKHLLLLKIIQYHHKQHLMPIYVRDNSHGHNSSSMSFKKYILFYFQEIYNHVLICLVCYDDTLCVSFKSMTEVHSFCSIFLSLLYGKSVKVTLFIPFILQTMSISKRSVKALYKFLFFGVIYWVFH